ncbi:MAG: metallophosphoesterase family protein [Thermodesulfobacteriota bacterium]
MRLAVFGDLHGNLAALEAVLRDAQRRGADGLVHLGDLLGEGPGAQDAAVVGLLLQHGIPGVVGDAELDWLERHGREPAGGGGPSEGAQVEGFLRGLPAQLAVEEAGVRFLFAHASPAGPREEGLGELAEDELLRFLEGCGADVLTVGHTHRPLVRRAGSRLLLNPGSAGGGEAVSYLLLDTAEGLQVGHVRLPAPV